MTRRPLPLLLCILLFLCAVAPVSAQSPTGVFTGNSRGYGGEMAVQVTLDGGVITAVDVLSHSETQGIGTVAIDTIPQRIIEAQSVNVDVVAGCTMASKAVIEAATAALIEAGVDLSLYTADAGDAQDAQDAQSQTVELSTDVLVIGAGAGGLTCATFAKDAGADVLVLEKMAVTGGASSISSGATNSCGSKFQLAYGITDDSPEVLMYDLLRAGHDYNQLDVAQLFADNTGDSFDWLVDIGVQYTDPAPGDEHTAPRTFLATGSGISITDAIFARSQESEVPVMLNTKATHLLVENGAVVGCEAEGSDATKYVIKAPVTVLATGGYGANREMLTEYLLNVPYYGHASSTGDGHRMAEEIGAQILHMDFGKVYPGGWEYAPGLAKIQLGHTNACIKETGAIIIGTNGERVFREGGYNYEFRNAIKADPAYMLYMLLDQSAFDFWSNRVVKAGMITAQTLETILAENGASVPVIRHADTLEALAAEAGMDPAVLTQTVQRWNDMVEKGVDEDFGRTALAGTIGDGPYYLVEQKLRFATTMGGVKIDTDFQVCNTDDQVIPGLLAIGEVAYGVHGDDTITGSALTWAITSGRLCGPIAAQNAAD